MDRLLIILSFSVILGIAQTAVADDLEDGIAASDRGDYVGALKLLRPLADMGNVKAQQNLGLLYREGRGVPQDYKEAAKWYQKAADQGDSNSEANLGFMYGVGQGVPQDYKASMKWFLLAAQQGDTLAQSNLGRMYSIGLGVPQDNVHAHMWLNLAASAASGAEAKVARDTRDSVASKLTGAELQHAQELATQCQESGFKNCN